MVSSEYRSNHAKINQSALKILKGPGPVDGYRHANMLGSIMDVLV